ncbi:MAG: phosphatase PAP2 family protein [SAR202 cluster bacterium]|nr:phosphatase PAP2 family protein [SAR202 cluster bacterium]MDP6512221.1 phosphatase PAP2 family protein [SAR202 cluster bacterium]MDP6713626.1 phosphatase PAP2 family protein [SAR202 cluster bacterium]
MAHADERLFLWLNGFVGTIPALDRVVTWLVSDYLIPVSMALALMMLWFTETDRKLRERQQIGVFVALTAMALSSLVVFIINDMYIRPRPFETLDVTLLFYRPTDPSFPSNAAAAAFGIAFAIWGVNRRIGYMFIAAAAVYSFSRVYAGVHYPLDIVASALIAAPVTWLTFQGRNLLMPILKLVMKAARILCLA